MSTIPSNDKEKTAEWTVEKAGGLPRQSNLFGLQSHNLSRRALNVPLLIQKGAVYITHAHDNPLKDDPDFQNPEGQKQINAQNDKGWIILPEEEWLFSVISYWNTLQGDWASEAPRYVKPSSYKEGKKYINDQNKTYDGKYLQILWSAAHRGLTSKDVFLDTENKPLLREFISETLNGILLMEGIIPQSETSEDDYRGLHRAPGKGSGDPLWNVAQQVYPEDFYTLPIATSARYYGAGEAGDMNMVSIIRKYHNKPNASVKVYRAVPEPEAKTLEREIKELEGHLKTILRRGKIPLGWKSYDQISAELDRLKAKRDSGDATTTGAIKTINPGDWVTLGISYARQHGESALRGRYVVLTRTVKAKDLYTDGNSLYEWGWDP